MTLAEPVRLSKSLDNLDLDPDDMPSTLPNKENISKSVDQLQDDFSIPSRVPNSVDLNTYFDNAEGIGQGSVHHRIMSPQSDVGNDFTLDELEDDCCSLKSPDIVDSALGSPGIEDLANQSESLHHELEHAKKPHNRESDSEPSCPKYSSKRKDIVSSMLVLHNREQSLNERNWDEVAIDRDIQGSVNEFIKLFFEAYLEESSNDERILLLKALHEQPLKSEISKWLCGKLQVERDGWSLTLRSALKEVEKNRKLALKAVTLTQECSQQLQLMLESLNISDTVLEAIPVEHTRESIQRSLELLMAICNALMEDRFRAMELLEPDGQGGGGGGGGGLLAEHLKEHLEAGELLHSQRMEEVEVQAKEAEVENLKLVKEVAKMKKVLHQRQQDVQLLRKQVADINDLVATRQVKLVDKYTSMSPCDERSLEVGRKHPVLSTDTIFTLKRFTQTSHRPGLESHTNAQRTGPSAIHISQEKLHALKQRAKKLEDSLYDAIASMDKLRKSSDIVTSSHNKTFAKDISLSPIVSTAEYRDEISTSQVSTRKDWHRPVFEVKGAPPTTTQADPKTIHPHVSIPKLNLKHPRRKQVDDKPSASERAPPARDVWKQTESTRSVELSATLAQLKAFKPQVGKVSKCLRCQKLFRPIDNHKLACLYHTKRKERVEKYTEGGQLVRVMYIWTCCKQEIESEGCSYGQHV